MDFNEPALLVSIALFLFFYLLFFIAAWFCLRRTSTVGDGLTSILFSQAPNPGMITLTVARRVTGSKSSASSLKSSSTQQDTSGTSDTSDNTVICRQPKNYDIECSTSDEFSCNPVIQRLTGNNKTSSINPTLRNESYYKVIDFLSSRREFLNYFDCRQLTIRGTILKCSL